MCRRFSDKCYTCFCFQFEVFVNLFSCVFIQFLSIQYLFTQFSFVYIYILWFSHRLFFFFIAFLPCNSFEISTAVTIVVTLFLCKISAISRKLECLCETSGIWVGESDRMLFVLAAYGHFHWHEETLTSNRRTISVMHIESLLNCFNALSLWPVCVPLHLSFSHHKWNCTKSFTVLTHLLTEFHLSPHLHFHWPNSG